jgi:hypothetical protein
MCNSCIVSCHTDKACLEAFQKSGAAKRHTKHTMTCLDCLEGNDGNSEKEEISGNKKYSAASKVGAKTTISLPSTKVMKKLKDQKIESMVRILKSESDESRESVMKMWSVDCLPRQHLTDIIKKLNCFIDLETPQIREAQDIRTVILHIEKSLPASMKKQSWTDQRKTTWMRQVKESLSESTILAQIAIFDQIVNWNRVEDSVLNSLMMITKPSFEHVLFNSCTYAPWRIMTGSSSSVGVGKDIGDVGGPLNEVMGASYNATDEKIINLEMELEEEVRSSFFHSSFQHFLTKKTSVLVYTPLAET